MKCQFFIASRISLVVRKQSRRGCSENVDCDCACVRQVPADTYFVSINDSKLKRNKKHLLSYVTVKIFLKFVVL